MKKITKRILFIGTIVFLLMQLYQPSRNEGSKKEMTESFVRVYTVPENIKTVLRTSCYDCHSNNTYYPWYSNIQPIRFFMDSHIEKGKKDLNFDEFGNYSKRKQKSKLDGIVKQIKSDEMPLSSYTLIHKEAILTTAQKKEVIYWMNKIKDSISL
ncbi:heme-binding domain-containing protein [Flavobacterium daejeonense]|uniref:heme-binding domain-containing protein n=1 Tax=Flavobacterium daejeonense TaxID=350893 RepID=UPI00047DFA96|nr:heme-binding domain-containing protein [Flavobacterium daejeonense]